MKRYSLMRSMISTHAPWLHPLELVPVPSVLYMIPQDYVLIQGVLGVDLHMSQRSVRSAAFPLLCLGGIVKKKSHDRQNSEESRFEIGGNHS